MILSWCGVMVGAGFFFLGVDGSSRSETWKGMLWSVLAISGLAIAAAGIITLIIPGFFR